MSIGTIHAPTFPMVVSCLVLALLSAGKSAPAPKPVPPGRVVAATLLGDLRTAVVAVEQAPSIDLLAQKVRSLEHVELVQGVALGDGKGFLMVRTDANVGRIAPVLDGNGLRMQWTFEEGADAFTKHVTAPVPFVLPNAPEGAAFRTADQEFKAKHYDLAERQYDLLAQDYQLHHWAVLRLADLTAVVEGKDAGCAGYQHVMAAAPLHLAGRLATLRASYLGCEGASLPPWTETLQSVRRDDNSGQLLLDEARWVFWHALTPFVAASMLDNGPALFTPRERNRLLATATLGLANEALDTFAASHLKAITAQPDEAWLRLVATQKICHHHETVNRILSQKPWVLPKPIRAWVAAWRGHLTHCTSQESAESLATAANDDVAAFDRMLASAAKRIDAVQAVLKPDDKRRTGAR